LLSSPLPQGHQKTRLLISLALRSHVK
jgi:hypothetical protein